MADQQTDSTGPTEAWARIGDLNVRYIDWGGSGTPLLALHGLASSANWYDIVAPLLRDRFRIVAPDQRGHGQTTNAPTCYDWRTLCSDLVGLLDELELDSVSLMGHSWGGNVAINFAANHPARVKNLVMIDGGYLNGRLLPNATFETWAHRVRPRDVSGNREEFLDRLRAQMGPIWSSELERIVQTMVYVDDDGMIQDILRPENHAQVIRAMWDEPSSETLPRIKCPALIVPAGSPPERADSEYSVMRRTMVAAAEEALVNGRVHWIQDTIHDIGYHKPNELAQVVADFLSEG